FSLSAGCRTRRCPSTSPRTGTARATRRGRQRSGCRSTSPASRSRGDGMNHPAELHDWEAEAACDRCERDTTQYMVAVSKYVTMTTSQECEFEWDFDHRDEW